MTELVQWAFVLTVLGLLFLAIEAAIYGPSGKGWSRKRQRTLWECLRPGSSVRLSRTGTIKWRKP